MEPECGVQARLWGSCGESPHRCGAGSTGGGVRTAGRRHGEALGHSAWRCHCLARLPFLFPFRAVSESPPQLFPRTPESSVYPPHQGARFTPRSSSAPGPRRSCSEARRKQGRASTPPPVLGAGLRRVSDLNTSAAMPRRWGWYPSGSRGGWPGRGVTRFLGRTGRVTRGSSTPLRMAHNRQPMDCLFLGYSTYCLWTTVDCGCLQPQRGSAGKGDLLYGQYVANICWILLCARHWATCFAHTH